MAVLPALGGCSDTVEDWKSTMHRNKTVEGVAQIPPGLDPLYKARPVEAPPVAAPVMVHEMPMPVDPALLPFPMGGLPMDQAELILTGDPVGLRFLALKHLTAQGLLPLIEAAPRRDANLAALLPLSQELGAPVGLDRPIPPLSDLTRRLTRLYDPAYKGTAQTRKNERDFLADSLLPLIPASRQKLLPPDGDAARKHLARLGRLEEAGVISPSEHMKEAALVEAAIASGAIPPKAEPPPPPPPPKKKKTGSGRGNRIPGGVSGKLEVIPSPPGVDAPKLPANFSAPAGLFLLSMGTATHGEKAFDALKKEFPELADLGFKVSKADLGDLGSTYRLIAGPVDGARANTLCAALKTKGQTCQPTPFPP